jgi:hypothetical protein
MTGPSWLGWLCVAVFLAVAGYCVLRLVVADRVRGYPGCHRALDTAHLVMALGMAAMCSPVGGPVPVAGWQTVFLLMAAWFAGAAWRARRTGVRVEPLGWHGGGLHHAAAALGMLYMLSVMPHGAHEMSDAWMGAHPSGGGPALGWVVVAYFGGSAVLLGRHLARAAVPPGGWPAVLAGRRVATACQLAMALGMGYLSAPLGG